MWLPPMWLRLPSPSQVSPCSGLRLLGKVARLVTISFLKHAPELSAARFPVAYRQWKVPFFLAKAGARLVLNACRHTLPKTAHVSIKKVSIVLLKQISN